MLRQPITLHPARSAKCCEFIKQKSWNSSKFTFLLCEVCVSLTVKRLIGRVFSLADQESSQGFIRVQAPQFSKVSMAVQLTGELQAADVLSRFLSQDR